MLRRVPDNAIAVAGQPLKYMGDIVQQLSCHLTPLLFLCAPLTGHFVFCYLSYSGQVNVVGKAIRSTPLKVIKNMIIFKT